MISDQPPNIKALINKFSSAMPLQPNVGVGSRDRIKRTQAPTRLKSVVQCDRETLMPPASSAVKKPQPASSTLPARSPPAVIGQHSHAANNIHPPRPAAKSPPPATLPKSKDNAVVHVGDKAYRRLPLPAASSTDRPPKKPSKKPSNLNLLDFNVKPAETSQRSSSSSIDDIYDDISCYNN